MDLLSTCELAIDEGLSSGIHALGSRVMVLRLTWIRCSRMPLPCYYEICYESASFQAMALNKVVNA